MSRSLTDTIDNLSRKCMEISHCVSPCITTAYPAGPQPPSHLFAPNSHKFSIFAVLRHRKVQTTISFLYELKRCQILGVDGGRSFEQPG